MGLVCLTVNCMGCICSWFDVFCKKKKKKKGEKLHLLLLRFAATLFLLHPPSPSAPKSTDLVAFLVSGVSMLSDSCEMIGLVGFKQCGVCVAEVVLFWGFLFVFPLVDVVLGLSFGEVAVSAWWPAECSEPPDVLAAQYL